MRKYRNIGALFLSLLLSAAFAASASAGSFSDLKKAILSAPAGGTLVLSEDFVYDISADSEVVSTDGVVIDKALTIDGNGKTVDAQGISRVFYISADASSPVLFKNLTITKGGSQASGGGIYIAQQADAGFTNVTITKCGSEKGVHTRDGGAAVFIDSKAKAAFTDCTISENTGKDRAGGIYLRGNAIFKNTKILNNSGGSRGGGLYVDPGYKSQRGGEWGGNVQMYNCTVSGNKGGRGGGIYVNPENTTLNLFENCTISNNDVSANSIGNGGGILFYNANAKMVNCTVVGNKAKNGGGVVLDVVTTLDIVTSTIAGNIATVGGAGLYAHDGSHPEDTMKAVGTANLMGCVIVGNMLSSDVTETLQDIAIHYSDNTDKSTSPDLGWEARNDGKFVSSGYNVLGTMDIQTPEGVSLDVPITLLASDIEDAEGNAVLVYVGGVPQLKDNGGDVYTVALADESKAAFLIPSDTSWLPSVDARNVERQRSILGSAGAYQAEVSDNDSSSGGCSSGLGWFAVFIVGAFFLFSKRGSMFIK